MPNRNFIGSEIDVRYFDIINKRLREANVPLIELNEVTELGIPPKTKVLGILPTTL